MFLFSVSVSAYILKKNKNLKKCILTVRNKNSVKQNNILYYK